MRKETKRASENIQEAKNIIARLIEKDSTPTLVKEKSVVVIETLNKCIEELDHISRLYVQ